MTADRPVGREAGLLVPLFSLPSSRSWGIGEIADIEPVAAWLAHARQSILQLLPINEMAPGQTSPYSAISAMAIDPLFISLHALEDFTALGGEDTLEADARRSLEAARASRAIDYGRVRALKHAALVAAFARFRDGEWRRRARRADELRDFIDEQRWWLDDYALFRALHAAQGERSWTGWVAPLRNREPDALAAARRDFADEILFRQYLQWIADRQWREARRRAGAVALFGDLPFMVDLDSADVWAQQPDFDLEGSVGVPPDAFSVTGQDWGLPPYRWDIVRKENFAWLAARARRAADLYDGYRIDHVVGFYRTYVRPLDGRPAYFTPADEPSQVALGEEVLRVFGATGARIIAEDLGTVPDFVRDSLERLGIPGYKVLRWERAWSVEGRPFHAPPSYPRVSVATTGTHDTEPLVVWWERASADDRRQIARILSVVRRAPGELDRAADFQTVRDVLLHTLFDAGSDILILPVQDVFGWRDRINEPATISERNWTFRLPWFTDRLEDAPEARERAAALWHLSERSDRGLT